jgi:hypothetical protein
LAGGWQWLRPSSANLSRSAHSRGRRFFRSIQCRYEGLVRALGQIIAAKLSRRGSASRRLLRVGSRVSTAEFVVQPIDGVNRSMSETPGDGLIIFRGLQDHLREADFAVEPPVKNQAGMPRPWHPGILCYSDGSPGLPGHAAVIVNEPDGQTYAGFGPPGDRESYESRYL